MANQTTILCVGGPWDGKRVDYRGAVFEVVTPVMRTVSTGLAWPSSESLVETVLGPAYWHSVLSMQREDGRVESFDFYLPDGFHRDDVLRALTAGYRKPA